MQTFPVGDQNLVVELWAGWEVGANPLLKLRRGGRLVNIRVAEIPALIQALTAAAAELDEDTVMPPQ